MLRPLSLKWKWRQRREAAGKPTDAPNLVFGGDVHVVWEKFCRYFDVDRGSCRCSRKYTIGPGGHRAARRREHDRGRGGGGHHLHRPCR